MGYLYDLLYQSNGKCNMSRVHGKYTSSRIQGRSLKCKNAQHKIYTVHLLSGFDKYFGCTVKSYSKKSITDDQIA